MKSVQTDGLGTVDIVDIERPILYPTDALMRIRACGVSGTDAHYLHMGRTPLGPNGQMSSMPLGHEVAGEIVEVGAEVTDLKVGDRVVVNPMAAPSGIIGRGGALGGMREYLLLEDVVVGKSVAVFPDTVPFDLAALTEPMAVALHCVNRSEARPTDKVVVFGAGPVGLGAAIWLKLRGVEHVVVADVIPERLETALAVGVDAVIDSCWEDVTACLVQLHGEGANALGQRRPATDIYIDAAGVASVVNTALTSAKRGAKLITVALHKTPELVDFGAMQRSEMTIIGAQGYPTEIFEVAQEMARHQERFARLISHRIPFRDIERAFELTLTPGAAEKVVVTFDDQH
ncbi:MAG: zinc-dependent alcohol dehydrogenase [Frankia sp.]